MDELIERLTDNTLALAEIATKLNGKPRELNAFQLAFEVAQNIDARMAMGIEQEEATRQVVDATDKLVNHYRDCGDPTCPTVDDLLDEVVGYHDETDPKGY